MASPLPLLPTMGVGSYASPGWLAASRERLRDGSFGAADIQELFDDATRIAVADQVEAGLDVISDGELRRNRFVYSTFDRIAGLKRQSPARKLGVPGYDMAPHFVAAELPTAPDGLGIVEEFAALKRLAPERRLKVALPGPLTFGGGIGPGSLAASDVMSALAKIVRCEVQALVAAGADHIQLDEPGFAKPPYDFSLSDAAAVISETLTGLPGHHAVHICFGNNAGRPVRDRRLSRLFPAIEAIGCHQLVLEFANREMSEVDCLARLADHFEIAAGVIDVKSFHLESADDVARRIDQVLRHVPAARLWITADCGFSALPRHFAREKMRALVEGARLVRGRL